MPVARVLTLIACLPCAMACADTVHGSGSLGAGNGNETSDARAPDAQTPDAHASDAHAPDDRAPDARAADARTPQGSDAATPSCAPRYTGAVKDDPRDSIPSGDCRRPTITGAMHHEDANNCWLQFPAGADDTTLVAFFVPSPFNSITTLGKGQNLDSPCVDFNTSSPDVYGWRDEGCGKARLCGFNVCGLAGNTDGIILMPCGWTPDD